jgi:hypothetical protein
MQTAFWRHPHPPPEWPTARRSAVWPSVSAWARGAPQGCPGACVTKPRTRQAVREMQGGPAKSPWRDMSRNSNRCMRNFCCGCLHPAVGVGPKSGSHYWGMWWQMQVPSHPDTSHPEGNIFLYHKRNNGLLEKWGMTNFLVQFLPFFCGRSAVEVGSDNDGGNKQGHIAHLCDLG